MFLYIFSDSSLCKQRRVAARNFLESPLDFFFWNLRRSTAALFYGVCRSIVLFLSFFLLSPRFFAAKKLGRIAARMAPQRDLCRRLSHTCCVDSHSRQKRVAPRLGVRVNTIGVWQTWRVAATMYISRTYHLYTTYRYTTGMLPCVYIVHGTVM